MFDLITKWTEAGKESPWKCHSCEGAGAKILKIVNVLSAKVVENEKVLSEHSGRLDRLRTRGSSRIPGLTASRRRSMS
jgi:hypothetical protein